MSRLTKQELVDENDELRAKLEEAYAVIGDALGYDNGDESEEGEERDSDEEDED